MAIGMKPPGMKAVKPAHRARMGIGAPPVNPTPMGVGMTGGMPGTGRRGPGKPGGMGRGRGK